MNNIYQPYANLMGGYQMPGIQGMQAAPAYEEIKRVNGPEGARNYRMAPNASALLMDNTENRIFMVAADASGLTNITPLRVEIETPEKPVDIREIERRLSRIEERMNENGKHIAGADSAGNEQP